MVERCIRIFLWILESRSPFMASDLARECDFTQRTAYRWLYVFEFFQIVDTEIVRTREVQFTKGPRLQRLEQQYTRRAA